MTVFKYKDVKTVIIARQPNPTINPKQWQMGHTYDLMMTIR